MKVLGIAASHRQGGNSEILLDKVLEGCVLKGAETEKVVLNKLHIRLCRACRRCYDKGLCYIKDDMAALYKKLESCDAIVISSPVYFGSVTAYLKAMIDRCNCLWSKKFVLRKIITDAKRKRRGIFIAVSSYNRPRFFRNSKEIVNILFMMLGVKMFKELYVPNLEDAKEVLKKKDILAKALRYGMALGSG